MNSLTQDVHWNIQKFLRHPNTKLIDEIMTIRQDFIRGLYEFDKSNWKVYYWYYTDSRGKGFFRVDDVIGKVLRNIRDENISILLPNLPIIHLINYLNFSEFTTTYKPKKLGYPFIKLLY